MIEKIYLVEVKYTGSNSDKTYIYHSYEHYNVDDIVKVPLGIREKTAIVVKCFETREVIGLKVDDND